MSETLRRITPGIPCQALPKFPIVDQPAATHSRVPLAAQHLSGARLSGIPRFLASHAVEWRLQVDLINLTRLLWSEDPVTVSETHRYHV